MYTADHEGKFHAGKGGGDLNDMAERWPAVLQELYSEDKMRTCPSATKSAEERASGAYRAWSGTYKGKTIRGSYGLNECMTDRNIPGEAGARYYRSLYRVKHTSKVPVFFDCIWPDLWPFATNTPPQQDGDEQELDTFRGMGPPGEMGRVCINRHQYAVNGAFADMAVRKVDLKELWTLPWAKTFDIRGKWTLAGGVQPDNWPKWMRSLRDY